MNDILLDNVTALLAQLDDLPNNQTVTWPLAADPKIAIAATLKAALEAIGFTDDKRVPVIMMGSFHKALLTVFDKTDDPQIDGKPDPSKWKLVRYQPVVVVGRTTDRAERAGIGETFGNFPAAQIVAPPAVLGSAPEAMFYGEFSVATIDISILDTNPRRIERLYTLVKQLMIQVQQTLMTACGFLEVIRVDGGDGMDVDTDNPIGIGIVFERHLTYRVKYVEAIMLAPQLVNLTLINFHVEASFDPSGEAEIEVDA